MGSGCFMGLGFCLGDESVLELEWYWLHNLKATEFHTFKQALPWEIVR